MIYNKLTESELLKDKYTIDEAAKAGISFSANIPTPSGSQTVLLSLEEVAKYINSPPTFTASNFGLSETDYNTWFEQGGAVTCSSLTKNKKPCKNVVASPEQLSPKEWLSLQGEYCVVHGGPDREAVIKLLNNLNATN